MLKDDLKGVLTAIDIGSFEIESTFKEMDTVPGTGL